MKAFGLMILLVVCAAGCSAPTAPTAAPGGPSASSVVHSTADADSDADGVADTADNCPTLANPDQRDNDGDGIGDLCDWDNDNDGTANEKDNCAWAPNPAQEDWDGDRLGDACDPDDDNDRFDDSVDRCPRERGSFDGCIASVPRLIELVDTIGLDGGMTNGLRAKLEAAAAAIARDDPSAVNLLKAFIAELEALARNGMVAQTTADALITQARAVIAQL